MKRILLMFTFLMSGCVIAQASQCVQTPYATNGQVTAVNLNAGLQEPCTIMNGALDNTNANTAAGYRFYQSVSALPAFGNTGQVYYLTSDNSLNFDTGTSFIKTIGISGSPAQGDVVYYGASGLNYLAVGTTGTPLITQGAVANPAYGEITASNTVSTSALIGALSAGNGASIFGAAVSKTITTAYQAATDGIVSFGVAYGASSQELDCISDSSATPSTIVTYGSTGNAGQSAKGGCSMPVKKNNYYEATASIGQSSYVLTFTPIGS